ncbi:MAG: hypothetical protein ACT4OP_10005 [Actinomycetota bacterium]
MGDVRIDLAGIRDLFNPDQVVPAAGLVLVEAVARCGITCFEITFRRTASTAVQVYPPEMSVAEPQTVSVDCAAEPAEIEVRPAAGLDPTWSGATTGCEAVLAFGRWAFYSHYFHLEGSETLRFTQTPGPWAEPKIGNPACLGDPSSPPACDMGHESEALFSMTIDSAVASDSSVTIKGVEWDLRWVGEYDLRGALDHRTLVVECDKPIDAESDKGVGWKRILDACLLAELVAAGEDFPGLFAVYGDGEGTIWGLDHVGEIELP